MWSVATTAVGLISLILLLDASVSGHLAQKEPSPLLQPLHQVTSEGLLITDQMLPRPCPPSSASKGSIHVAFQNLGFEGI